MLAVEGALGDVEELCDGLAVVGQVDRVEIAREARTGPLRPGEMAARIPRSDAWYLRLCPKTRARCR